MRPVTTALQDLLASWGPDVNVRMADLYQFVLQGGETINLTSYQTALSAPAPNTDTPLILFPLGPPIERTKITEKIGVEVSRIDITLYAGPNDEIALGGTLTWQAALHAGLFDGAWCRVWRAYITPPGTVVGTISRFFGRVGEVEIGRSKTRIQVNSLTDLLTVQMPRRLFQAACTHVFGEVDANGNTVGMCGYDRYDGLNANGVATGIGAHTETAITSTDGAVVSDNTAIYVRFSPSYVGSYDNGTITCLTGQNAGNSRTIGRLEADYYFDSIGSISGVFFLKPFIFPVVSNTDTFRLLPGCDHTLATCRGAFNNAARFGGFPDIPPPEAAI